MLTNARRTRAMYIERVKDAADSIINVIDVIDENECWDIEGISNDIDIMFYIEQDYGVDAYSDVNICDVYNYMASSIFIKDEGKERNIIEALEEIFDIGVNETSFVLSFKLGI